MYIAMNRFQVKKDRTEEFEHVWLNRDTNLPEVPGFIEFQMLRGPEHEDYILYSSHTLWNSEADFAAWTKSLAFRKTHQSANTAPADKLTLGHPQFEGFEVIQKI